MNLNKKQSRLLLISSVVILAITVSVLAFTKKPDLPPSPNSSGYYEGPWVNHKGDLIDTRTGKMLQKGYSKLPPSNRLSIE